MRLWVEKADLPRIARADMTIVIPARDEEDMLPRCLAALADQDGIEAAAVTLCVNNSRDDTATSAWRTARALGLAFVLVEVDLPRGGVGRARRLGHAVAMRHSPRARKLLSTDADSTAAPGWLAAMGRALDKAPAVLGRIEGLPDIAEGDLRRLGPVDEVEQAYLRLSTEFERLVSGRPFGLNLAGGANLGFRRQTYRALGGFRPLPSGEDRDLVRRALSAGLRAVHAQDAVVRASQRSSGRAPGGMADGIAARLAGGNPALDTALSPLRVMIDRHLRGEDARAAPISLFEAARDLPALSACVAELRKSPGPTARRDVLARFAARGDC
ncbi:glycosyltransferase [Rhodobacter sp. NSM]|uniref:glycosyltransferase n=1 Tax=Rhodobacter sp. NSM TaxID=3457501 RepID=UPI003FD65EFA